MASKEYAAVRRAVKREVWIKDHGPCVLCGTWEKLEIDHIDPSLKTMDPTFIWNMPEESRDEELKKCQVLCHECHRQKTAQEKLAKVEHGTLHMYNKYKCRCGPCRKAWSVYLRAYRRGKRIYKVGV